MQHLQRQLQNPQKVFINAAIVDSPGISSVSVFSVKPRFVLHKRWHWVDKRKKGSATDWENCPGASTVNMTNLTHSAQCLCRPVRKYKTHEITKELQCLGVSILSDTGCLPAWTLGTHSVGKPFYETMNIVNPREKAGYLFKERRVLAIQPEELLRRIKVKNARHLKIDTEGFDGKILAAFARYMNQTSGTSFRPLEISWECVHLKPSEQEGSMAMMKYFGYRCAKVNKMDCACATGDGVLNKNMHRERKNRSRSGSSSSNTD
eukprot:gnl/MRDRNA2_/MRDRNA2_80605_c0_seq1.p1 gnl/MRDRNA2_/MRDRNA2_80605_c0~~gnl/MRDRNA2_/MRDRNA2_80605_c0_seq1.p1  ORF type:complete len:263 (-),score=38.22 gnl/MRDRNA2_/MRDRNA2_80605_c0_seq1:248-1036(-)